MDLSLKPIITEKLALHYHDRRVPCEDVDMLRKNEWLTDPIMGLYFEYLQRTRGISYSTDTTGKVSKGVLFLSPEKTRLLRVLGSEVFPILLYRLDEKEHKYVFFPLNNAKYPQILKGSNWSLLVYSKDDYTMFHLDPTEGVNRSEVEKSALNIRSYFGTSAMIHEIACPQQQSIDDSGYFVLCFVDAIITSIRQGYGVLQADFQDVPEATQKKRGILVSLIEHLQIQQEKLNQARPIKCQAVIDKRAAFGTELRLPQEKLSLARLMKCLSTRDERAVFVTRSRLQQEKLDPARLIKC